MNTDGTGFKTQYSFSVGDGSTPCELIISGNTLYGLAEGGGAANAGTVFAINTDGTGFQTLYAFSQSDGSAPGGDPALSGITLFGTTHAGGEYGQGVVFAVKYGWHGFHEPLQLYGPQRWGTPERRAAFIG